MKFGLFIPQGWRMDLVGIGSENHWQVMRDLATYADSGPWDSLWVYDHFHTVPMPSDEATHEAWTLMAAYAATTSRIKIGQMCTAMSYRNPAYLAKVAATTDIIQQYVSTIKALAHVDPGGTILGAVGDPIRAYLRERKDTKAQNPGDQVKVKASDRLRLVKMDPVHQAVVPPPAAEEPKA